MPMHTVCVSKFVVKNGPINALQSVLNDYSEQGYEIVNLHQFMTQDGLKFSLVMKR
jgi:hypothetical protein